jgi:hypothetical protein
MADIESMEDLKGGSPRVWRRLLKNPGRTPMCSMVRPLL